MPKPADIEMTKEGATKFVNPAFVEALTALGWKEVKAAKTTAKESK